MNKVSILTKRLVKSGMLLVLTNFINQGIVFLSAPLFSRMMSTTDFGFFSSFVSLITIIQIIMTLNIYSSIYNAKIEYSKDDLRIYLKNIICFICIFGTVFIIILLTFANVIIKWFQLSFDALILACIYTLLYCIYTTLNTYLIANKDDNKSTIWASTLTFIFSVCNILFSLVFVSNMIENRYLGRCYGMILAVIVALIISFPYFKTIFRYTKCKISIIKNNILFGLRISIPLIFHSLSAIILSKMDQLMLLNLISPSKSGIYSYGNNFSHIFSTICQSFNTVYLPWYMINKKNNENKIIIERSNLYIKFIFIIFCCFYLFIPDILYFLSDSTYFSAIYSIQIVVIGMYFNYLYYFIVNFETYYKKTTYIALGTILSGISNIILNIILIPRYEDIGAAIATSASLILLFVFHAIIAKFFIKHEFEISIKRLSLSGIFAIIFAVFCIICREIILVRCILFVFVILYFVYEFLYKPKKGSMYK